MDTIEDTDLAITSYSNKAYSSMEHESNDGVRYLAVYGVLQALILQQDAVINLCESLGIPESINSFPKLKEIREIRNYSVGHPTKRNRKRNQPTSYHIISRATLRHRGFQLVSSYDKKGEASFKDVSIHELIADQEKYVSQVMNKVIHRLEEEDKIHKEKFRMEKLASIFSGTSYNFEKISESIMKKELIPLGEGFMKLIEENIQNFKDALSRRGIETDTYDSLKYLYEELKYPISKLKEYFQSIHKGEASSINENDACIFVFFTRAKVEELIRISQEIDEEYSS